MEDRGKRVDEELLRTLLKVPAQLPVKDFENIISAFTSKSADKAIATQELDRQLALVQNHLQLLSLYIKQNHLLKGPSSSVAAETVYYTKQELANRYRVSVRTVTNWIIDGLEVEAVGGIKRISIEAITRFKKSVKGKKFSWKSIRGDYRS